MKNNKRYYKGLDFIRLLACIAILLYHFGTLKGGYLAVCIFFVLSGYLSCISAAQKEKFSIISYYKNRLKIYIPLVIVVFLTISLVSCLSNITWLNLKPETTSVLLGYNNFWQLSVNLDYFARHINSPFIHLWYIAILLQFEILFPFMYIFFRKIGEKTNKIIPCIITLTLSLAFMIYFYKMSLTPNIMEIYYNTFTRIFSILFGLTLGFIHSYYETLVPEKLKNKPFKQIIFFIYIIILIGLFILIDASSKYFALSMILVTLITLRIIDYSTIDSKNELTIFEKAIKSLSSVSYEIYLIQYPVIFFFQNVNINNNFKLPLMIGIIVILSYILHFSINNKNKKLSILKYITLACLLSGTIYGAYQYYIAEDHTAEMKALKDELAENEKMIEQKQEEYAASMKQEVEELMGKLQDIENDESNLKSIITNLPVVGIGDSVMLGAVDNLYKMFPKGYFDAKISRTAWVANDILQDLQSKNLLGEPIILNLGANGDCSEACKKDIMRKCEGKEVFWLNVTNNDEVHFNEKLQDFASKYDNVHIIDWNNISENHPEYFVSDGIHLTPVGREAYTKTIYDAIYEIYSQKYIKQKEEIMKKYEEEQKNKISFYGNDILLKAFDYIQKDFKEIKYTVDKETNYESLKKDVQKVLNEKTLNYKVVLAFDNNTSITLSQYQELIKLCSDYKIYILSTSEQTNQVLDKIKYDNVKIIDFYQVLKKHNNYIMADKVHLTEEGNIALSRMLYENVIN